MAIHSPWYYLMRVKDDIMSASEESDEPDVSSPAAHELLTDVNLPSHSNSTSHPHLPTWSFPPMSSSSSSSRNPHSPGNTEPPFSAATVTPRSVSRHPSAASSDLDSTSRVPLVQQPSLFNTPNRSIFSSGPPTSSLSANTAQASMSAPSPVNSARPLSALTVPSSSSGRRSVHYQNDDIVSARRNRMPRAEKDIDDPSITVERTRSAERRGNSTPTALTRLFTAPEASTPTISRHASYIRTPSGTAYTRCKQP